MASTLRHFADPHLLLQTQYNSSAIHVCDICQSKMAGLTGYRCNACDFDIHEACADYFKETISFFAHPWHHLTLSRMPSSSVGWVCDLCTEACPPGNLVYRCIDCLFDVHPLCTMLPQTIRSPLHPQHDLRMVPSKGTCSACCKILPVWHYLCSCNFRLHIACVSGAPNNSDPSTTSGQSNTTTTQAQGSSASQTTGHAGKTSTAAAAFTTTVVATAQARSQTASSGKSRSSSVGKLLLKASLRLAINAATGGMASPVLDVLSAAFD